MAERCIRMGVKVLNKDFLYYASLGHKATSVDPTTFSSLSGFRQGISVFNIEKIKESVLITKHFIASLFKLDGSSSILFIDLEEVSNVSTKSCALRALEPYFIDNWSSGILTNSIVSHKIDAILVLSAKDNNFIIQEANKLNIPVISVVDSDVNVNMVSFPIWGNDNSIEFRHQLTAEMSSMILESKLMKYGLSCS